MKLRCLSLIILQFFLFSLLSYADSALGNFVWDDLDEDGVQDVGEPGIAGLVVTIYRSSDNVSIATVNTSTLPVPGLFSFTNSVHGIVPGVEYDIEVVIDECWDVSPKNIGNPGDLPVDLPTDSDADEVFSYAGRPLGYPTGRKGAIVFGKEAPADPGDDDFWDIGLIPRVCGTSTFSGSSSSTFPSSTFISSSSSTSYPSSSTFISSSSSTSIPSSSTFISSSSSTSIPSSSTFISSSSSTSYPSSSTFISSSSSTSIPSSSTFISSSSSTSIPSSSTFISSSSSTSIPSSSTFISSSSSTSIPSSSTFISSSSLTSIPSSSTFISSSSSSSIPSSSTFISSSSSTSIPSSSTFISSSSSSSIPSSSTFISSSSSTSIPSSSTFISSSSSLPPSTTADPSTVLEIGDLLWYDLDGDGVQDVGEPPVVGVQLSIYNYDVGTGTLGSLVATDETDASGNYYFYTSDGLLPNTDYKIILDRAADFTNPAKLQGYGVTLPDQDTNGDTVIDSSDDVEDSDGMTMSGMPSMIITTPSLGEQDHTFDIGFISKVEIGNFVWIDADQGGDQDLGETKVSGVTVSLYDIAGNKLASTLTDLNGEYYFDQSHGLVPLGNYKIVLDNPNDFAPLGALDGLGVTFPNLGGDDLLDSDAVNIGVFPTIIAQAPVAGSTDYSFDFGFIERVEIGNYVWIDSNEDGKQDASEIPVPGVTVSLYDTGGNLIASEVTDSNGEYYFDRSEGVEPNTSYFVKLDNASDYLSSGALFGFRLTESDYASNSDDEFDSDAAYDGNNYPSISLDSPASGDFDHSFDFGFVKPANLEIGNYVWFDDNNDGIQDSGELPVIGVTVRLIDINTGLPVATKLTDSQGEYYFNDLDGLLPGKEYYVVLDNPIDFQNGGALDGYVLTTVDAGSSDEKDSDAALVNGIPSISLIAPASNAFNHSYDFGFVSEALPIGIGNFVWYDADLDGVQDFTEPIFEGVTVNLYDMADNFIASTKTDSNGEYYFSEKDGLLPSTVYKITLDEAGDYEIGGALSEFILTFSNFIDDDALDSDASYIGIYPVIMITSLGSGINYSYDFGFTKGTLLSSTQFVLDGLAAELLEIAQEAAAWRKKDKGRSCDKVGNNQKGVKLAEADGAYIRLWGKVWNELSSSSVDADPLPSSCRVENHSEAKKLIIKELKTLKKRAFFFVNKECVSNSKVAKRKRTKARRLARNLIRSIKGYPDFANICQ